MVDFVNLLIGGAEGDLSVQEVQATPGSEILGRTLRDLNVRERFGLMVEAIRSRDGGVQLSPPPDQAIREGDVLLVVGTSEQVGDFSGWCIAKPK